MKTYNIIDISQFSIWENELTNFQNQKRFNEAAELVSKIRIEIENQDLQRENESEWLDNVISEETSNIILLS
jgi:hypothetical protein